MKTLVTTTVILATMAGLQAEPTKETDPMAVCPMMKDHAAMDARGDKAMGFSQQKTTHHFRLVADGGSIEVSAKDPDDQASQAQIRSHLHHVAIMFEQGNFEIPMLVHDKMPAGASVMQQEKSSISYIYEETAAGGRVRIRANNPKALKAVHDFLRFQIAEHQTGDSIEIGS